MTDSEFLDAFESAALPPGAFRHRDHVRAAWLCLRHAPTPAAGLERFVSGLRRFAAAAGKPGLYHETITWAFLLIIRERMAGGPRDEGFDAFAERNPDVLAWKPSLLDRYYRAETLRSDLARAVFLLPDRLAPQDASGAPAGH
jgi:hypothetical protein